MISSSENTSVEGIPERIRQQLPERFRQFGEPELAEIRKQFDEIGQAPNPGKVARKIRKKKGMTIEEVAEVAEVDPSHVDLFEKCGDIHLFADLSRCDRLFGYSEEEEAPGDPLERFIAVMEPTEEEEKELRRDLQQDLLWLAELLKKTLPEGLWKEVCEMPPKDPWEEKPSAKPKARRRLKRPPLSPMASVGAQPSPRKREPEGDRMIGNAEQESGLVPTPSPQSLSFKIQLVAIVDGAIETAEIALLEKGFSCIEEFGMTLAESKSILLQLQKVVVEQQIQAYLETRSVCADCGKKQGNKGHRDIVFRTLFGNIEVESPRLRRCQCQPTSQKSFSPLTELFHEKISPELSFMESKWSSLVSYGQTAKVLQEFLPVGEKLNAATIRNHTLKVAERCESELDEERYIFIDGCQRKWDALPDADGPITVGIDGGYLRSWHNRKNNFEVIVGKSVPADGKAKCFGLVQTEDSKPKRRLFDLLKSQGMQENQKIFFLSDGETAVRELQLFMNPKAEHMLDWFHITMRITVLKQFIKGLVRLEKEEGKYERFSPAREMQKALDSTKWKL